MLRILNYIILSLFLVSCYKCPEDSYAKAMKEQEIIRQKEQERFDKWCKEESKWPCRMVKKSVP